MRSPRTEEFMLCIQDASTRVLVATISLIIKPVVVHQPKARNSAYAPLRVASKTEIYMIILTGIKYLIRKLKKPK